MTTIFSGRSAIVKVPFALPCRSKKLIAPKSPEDPPVFGSLVVATIINLR